MRKVISEKIYPIKVPNGNELLTRNKTLLNRYTLEHGLDPRLTPILHPVYIGRMMLQKQLINPDNKHKSAINLCSGSSIIDFLINTNATKSWFLESTPIDAYRLERLVKKGSQATPKMQENLSHYEYRKFMRGYAQYLMGQAPLLEEHILLELTILGAKNIAITNNEKSVMISFFWNYPNQPLKEYCIQYLNAELSNIKRDNYYHANVILSELLKNNPAETFDVLYWKAASTLVKNYDDFFSLFLSIVAKPGFIVADEFFYKPDSDSFHYNSLAEWADNRNYNVKLLRHPLEESYDKLISRLRSVDDSNEFQNFSNVPYNYERYGLPVVFKLF